VNYEDDFVSVFLHCKTSDTTTGVKTEVYRLSDAYVQFGLDV